MLEQKLDGYMTLDGLNITAEEREIIYQQNCKNDAMVKHNILQALKHRKLNVISSTRINTNKYCKDITQLYIILKEEGFNVDIKSRTIYINDMCCGCLVKSYDKNKVYFSFF